MGNKIRVFFAALLALCMAACMAQAQTVMLACGYEYEIPDGDAVQMFKEALESCGVAVPVKYND